VKVSEETMRSHRIIIPCTAIAVGVVLFGMACNAQERLAFEVASIKPIQGFVNARGNASGPRITLSGYALEGLIMDAYQVQSWQLSGGPAWRDTDPFEIIAKAPGDASPTPVQVREMLRSLLEERFKLKVHRETKEGPIYALVVEKNGPKLRRSTGSDFSYSAGGLGGTVKLSYKKVSMNFFANQIASQAQLGRPVVDRTGLAGDWDLELTFVQSAAPPNSDLPDLFTALREQLGLKLESQKGPVEKLIIDGAKRPTAN
jgi:uncharacterized protein (TIGR03435 family)